MRKALRENMQDSLSINDVRTLCFDLEIEYESIPGEGKDGKIRELIIFFEQRGRLNDLINYLMAIRSHINWDQLKALDDQTESTGQNLDPESIQELMNLANQYNHIRKVYKNGITRDEQMKSVFDEMKTKSRQVSKLDISTLLNDQNPGKRLIAISSLTVQPNPLFLEELVQSTIERQQPFVQHKGIEAIKSIGAKYEGDFHEAICDSLNSLLGKLKPTTQRYASLNRIVNDKC